MDILDKLDEALKKPNVYYHRFIMSYKKESNDVHVFCEGNVDLGYYCELIERQFPEREIHKCFAECKNNVLKIWEYIDWNLYQKNRVLFFVDRDLSYWTGEPQSYDINVYVTDGYSFENDAVNAHMFLKILEDLYGFANYTLDEKQRIKEFYLESWKRFVDGSYGIMGCILYTYLTTGEHRAKNIPVKKCLNLTCDSIWMKTIENMPYIDFYRKKLEIGNENIMDTITGYRERFISECEHYSIRGKWCIEFMVKLLDYILDSGEQFAPSLYKEGTKKPKKLTELTSRGAMAVLGPKIVPPESLKTFLRKNLG